MHNRHFPADYPPVDNFALEASTASMPNGGQESGSDEHDDHGTAGCTEAAATLAAAVGVGRFVFTPILPLMQTQAGVTPQLGATMATANYLGYLVGAVAVILVPALGRNASALRLSTVSVLTSLGAMPLITAPEAWIALRAIAGGAGGAIMFVAAAGTVLNEVSTRSRHLAGWAYGGVGAGIALSGAAVLLVARSVTGGWHGGRPRHSPPP